MYPAHYTTEQLLNASAAAACNDLNRALKQNNIEQQMGQALGTTPMVIAGPNGTVHIGKLPRYPTLMQCPLCHQFITTTVYFEIGVGTILIGCFTGFWCVLCIDACKDALHKCPSCHAHLGKTSLI